MITKLAEWVCFRWPDVGQPVLLDLSGAVRLFFAVGLVTVYYCILFVFEEETLLYYGSVFDWRCSLGK